MGLTQSVEGLNSAKADFPQARGNSSADCLHTSSATLILNDSIEYCLWT